MTGIREARRALRRVAPEALPALRDELKKVAAPVVADIRANVPVRSGAARDSVRVTGGGNVVYLNAGRASVPYFGWLDFGGRLLPKGKRRGTQYRPVLNSGRYIYPAISRHGAQIQQGALKAIDAATRKAGF